VPGPSYWNKAQRRIVALTMKKLVRLTALVGLAAFLVLGAGAGAVPAGVAQDLAVLLSHPHRFVAGDDSVVLSPRELEAFVQIRDDRIVVGPGLGRVLAEHFRDRAPHGARLSVDGDRVTVVPSVEGRVLDRKATAAVLVREPAARSHQVQFQRRAPHVTTSELSALKIRDLVSEFTTYYPAGEPRVVNIKRAAQLLDGRILRAGGTFSMNQTLGERTLARGFVPAPSIYAGRYVDSIGGGISQVATTLYNAAFFAGLELVAHMPHSYYIDRYPVGREATISWGGPDLVFRNDWDAAVLMKLDATDTSITVRFYSSSFGRSVETTTGAPYRSTGPGGFTVDYTRQVFKDGRLLRDERFTTRYDPVDRAGTTALEQ
jgi:vancomycin resistance protein YoaR